MRYYRYITEEHARSEIKGEMTAYYEIADDQSFVRSLEVYPDSVAYSFDATHRADQFGMLPDAVMDAAAAAEYGVIAEISKEDFERFWSSTKVANR
jgi:hypothetical protein